MAADCLLIKLDSRGPVFTAGRAEWTPGFLFYKFSDDAVGPQDDAEHREFSGRYIRGQRFEPGDDQRPLTSCARDRVSRCGPGLTRTSLDELPQLFNVLRGRNECRRAASADSYEVESYELWHPQATRYEPGSPVLWQVSGGNRLPLDEMVRMIVLHRKLVVAAGCKIILQTLPVMWRGEELIRLSGLELDLRAACPLMFKPLLRIERVKSLPGICYNLVHEHSVWRHSKTVKTLRAQRKSWRWLASDRRTGSVCRG